MTIGLPMGQRSFNRSSGNNATNEASEIALKFQLLINGNKNSNSHSKCTMANCAAARTGARQEPLRPDMETDGSAGNATAQKPSSKAKSHTTQNIPIQEAAQSPLGSALPPHTPSPPRPPTTGNTTAGLGAEHADEPEVVHQPEEQPVPPLHRSTRERRPPERLGDYVQ
ncbi:hypothetical protein MRX96_029635 [Rhipicephalus microplus]